ncbi:GyrI-like domain-containing protein [Kaarinaea lacus]
MEVYERFVVSKNVVGIKTATSNTLEADPQTARIPALWQRFFSESIDEQISNKLDEGILFGVYTGYDNEQRGHYSLIAGREVSAIDIVPEGLVSIVIPQGHYLVFSEAGEMPAVIYSVWQTIWQYFSDSVEYVREYTTDFELYSNDNSSRVEVYIAIKK